MTIKLKEKIIKINRTLFELETGILLFGLFCQLFVFFVKDKSGYSLGLWMGILIAAASAIHMWWTLDRALELEEKAAVKSMTLHNILRYGFIIIAFALICVSKIANPLAAFLGVMGLKISAYMYFITKRISTWIYGVEILPPIILEEEPANEQEK